MHWNLYPLAANRRYVGNVPFEKVAIPRPTYNGYVLPAYITYIATWGL
jgi:hypothetical protein